MLLQTIKPAHNIIASKLSFLYAGFCISAWVPFVVFIKNGLNINYIELSRLILLMGIGSIFGMAIIGLLLQKISLRSILACGIVGIFLSMLGLCSLVSYSLTAILVFLFGLFLGLIEVSSNILGAHLEKSRKIILLPKLHAFYSLGEIVVLVSISALLFFKVSFVIALMIALVPFSIISLYYVSKLQILSLESNVQKLSLPKGRVIILAIVGSLILMLEGSMLDWSSFFMIDKFEISTAFASMAYLVFVCSMTISRYFGDKLIVKIGETQVILLGLALGTVALFMIVLSHHAILSYVFFSILGLAIANILPIAISMCSKQNTMSVVSAISAVSTCGYSALIIGPAFIGFIAQNYSLSIAFIFLAVMLLAMLGMYFIVKILSYLVNIHQHDRIG